jgi:cyclophilin family peptidyl-prolyl cis-trans isomerase
MRSTIISFAAVLYLAAGAAYAQDQTPPPADSSAPVVAPEDSSAAPADTSATPAAPDNSAASTTPTGPQPIDPSIPAMRGPQLLIQTSMGNITLQLDADRAPKTVAQILRYVRVKHYDGTIVYRVAKDTLIQMGSWDARGQGRPDFGGKLPLEVKNGLSNIRGTVGLARQEDPESGGADFFINIGDESPLDAAKDVPGNTTGYAVFGKVIAGMDVADKINAVTVGGGTGPMPPEQTPIMPILVRSVTVVPGSDSMMPAPASVTAKPAEKKKKS